MSYAYLSEFIILLSTPYTRSTHDLLATSSILLGRVSTSLEALARESLVPKKGMWGRLEGARGLEQSFL